MSDTPNDSRILPVNIVDEMKKSFISYSMAVIINRALPDVRDGLKPVHRRILYSPSRFPCATCLWRGTATSAP